MHLPSPGRPGRRRALPALLALALGLVLAAPGVALAHVSASPDTTVAGATSVVSFVVPHGCDGSPTTRISIEVPAQLSTVTPVYKTGWTIEKVMEPLDPPVDDGHGGTRTERVAEVVFTATTPLPDGYRDTVGLQVRLPAEPGQTLVFPTVQTCESGETAWVQVPQPGQTAEPENPAPTVVTTTAATAAPTPSSSPSLLVWVAVAMAALALSLGVATTLRARRGERR